jgi:tetratricopeptide (TPR) repeat protein
MVEALVEQEINERSAVFKVPLPVRTKKTEETHNYRLTNLYEENNNEIVLEVLLANPQINYSGTSKIVEYFLDRGEVDRVLPLLDSISDSKILAKFLTILICRGDNVDWGLINNRSNKESILSETAFLLAEKGDFAEARRVIEDNTPPLTENYSNALPDSFKIASLALITYIEKGDSGILSFWVATITSMTLDDSIKLTRIRIITNYLLERGSYEVVLNIISTESLATCRSYMREETKTLVNKFLESGDYDRAIIAGKLYPANTFPPIQGVIVKSLINAGKIDEAKTVTSSISDKIWRSSPLQEVALAYIKIGDYESAEAIIKGEAIDEHYKAGVLIELAAHNIRNNRRKEAKLQVEEVIRTNTKEQNVSHRNDLSPIILAYTECGMLSEAKQVAEQSGKFINRIDNFSYLNRKKCEYLTMVACGYARQGRFEEGLALLEGETSDEFRWFTIYANYLEYCAKEGLFEEFEKHTNYFSLVLQNDAYSMNGTKISDTQLATIIRQFHLAGKLNKLNTLIDDSLQTNLPDSTVKKNCFRLQNCRLK